MDLFRLRGRPPGDESPAGLKQQNLVGPAGFISMVCCVGGFVQRGTLAADHVGDPTGGTGPKARDAPQKPRYVASGIYRRYMGF